MKVNLKHHPIKYIVPVSGHAPLTVYFICKQIFPKPLRFHMQTACMVCAQISHKPMQLQNRTGPLDHLERAQRNLYFA